MKFMSWTLSRPSSTDFSNYYKLKDGEPWYSPNYELVDPKYFDSYNNRRVKGFVKTLEKHPKKFYSMGMHEFGISDNGGIFNMGYGQIPYPNGYYYNDPDKRVLNDAEDDIERPVPTSLRYFMHKYPEIRWALQFLATANSSGDRVTSILNNERKPLFYADTSGDVTKFVNKTDSSGNVIYVNAQDEFIRQVKRIAELYIEKGFPIYDIEIDFEKTWTVEGEDVLFSKVLERVKEEACIPLGLGLRVNLFAMTGEYSPSYYAWHNYSTIAKATVNGEQAVDEFQLMTYDFSWGGSSAGASTPLWWLKEVLEHINDLDNQGLLNAEDIFIGNAGYGRRWALNEDRMGVTFDYKQMVQLQNGQYIHNDGQVVYPDPDRPNYSEFPFRDQDFIPFAGYNDDESDYQINFPHVYDRFVLSENGGAEFININRPMGADYVTNYSLIQHPKFTGVQDYKATPDYSSGRVEDRGVVEMSNVQGDLPVISWDRKEGLPTYYTDAGNNTGKPEDQVGVIGYNLATSGTFRLIVQVTFPFYDDNSTTAYVNGKAVPLTTGDWYSFSLMQKNHFYDLGEFTKDGITSVEFRGTKGVIVGGVVACSNFDHNLTGGSVKMNTGTFPLFKRGNKQDDGQVSIIQAQFPDKMDLVAEVLRRPPRPVIVWEDIFTSHVRNEGEGYNLLGSGYYDPVTDGGFSKGTWEAYTGDDYSHARVDSRGDESTFSLNNKFSSNFMVQADILADYNDYGTYGLQLIKDNTGGLSGYLIKIDHSSGSIQLVRKEGITETVEKSIPISNTLKNMKGYRLTITAYVMKGLISFQVNDMIYLNEYKPKLELDKIAYGVYVSNNRAKLYKYNLSNLDRFERMERLQVVVDGEVVEEYGGIERNVPVDEHGFLIYTGYPANIVDTVKNPSDTDGEGIGQDKDYMAGTILETEVNPYEWSNDYENKVLSTIKGWTVGKHDVEVHFKDVGIWFRRFYVGDHEGMSISYNSDKVSFIRTANFINDYNCKGIAMWTLGQEDPSIYTYLPDSN